MKWMEAASCIADPDLWFSYRTEDKALAVSICYDCPVRKECLDYALSLPPGNLAQGIWAGHTKNYLWTLRARRKKAVRENDQAIHNSAPVAGAKPLPAEGPKAAIAKP